MTAEEAIRILEDDFTECPADCDGYCDICIEKAKEMAVEALKRDCEFCGYRIHSIEISKLNSCNDCKKEKDCANKPRLGEYCRINCKDWSEEE